MEGTAPRATRRQYTAGEQCAFLDILHAVERENAALTRDQVTREVCRRMREALALEAEGRLTEAELDAGATVNRTSLYRWKNGEDAIRNLPPGRSRKKGAGRKTTKVTNTATTVIRSALSERVRYRDHTPPLLSPADTATNASEAGSRESPRDVSMAPITPDSPANSESTITSGSSEDDDTDSSSDSDSDAEVVALYSPNDFSAEPLRVEDEVWGLLIEPMEDDGQPRPSAHLFHGSMYGGSDVFRDGSSTRQHGGAWSGYAAYHTSGYTQYPSGGSRTQGIYGTMSQWSGAAAEWGSSSFSQADISYGGGSTGSAVGVATGAVIVPRTHPAVAFKPPVGVSQAASGQVEVQETDVGVLADKLAHKLDLQDKMPSSASITASSHHKSHTQATANSDHDTTHVLVDTITSLVALLRDRRSAQGWELVRDLRSALRTMSSNTMQDARHIEDLLAHVHDMDGERTEIALWALGLLATNRNARAMREANAFSTLVAVVRHGSSKQKKVATWVLAKLAVNRINSSLIRDVGGISALMELVDRGDMTEKTFAIRTLAQLAMNSDNVSAIQDAGGIQALVSGSDMLGEASKAVLARALVRTHALDLKRRLANVNKNLQATLDCVPLPLTALLTHAQDSIDRLLARSDANRVSVLVTGALNAGKSTVLNAMSGALVCPIASEPATASLLTLRPIENADDDDDESYRLRMAATGELDMVGSSAGIYRRLRALNESIRLGPTDADRVESELVLEMPRCLPMFTRGSMSIELVDSPGANEAQSPYLSGRWLTALAMSDVMVVVLAYDQLQTNDVAQYWRKLLVQLPSRTSANNVLVFLNKCDDPVDSARLEEMRERCHRSILQCTGGRFHVPTSQIFVGSARSALVAQIALRLDRTMDQDGFMAEHALLCPIAAQVVGGRRTRVPASAAALIDLDDWRAVLEESGFPAFQRALDARTRSSALAHVYKVLELSEATVTSVQTMCEDYTQPLRRLLNDASISIERIEAAKENIAAHFQHEAKPSESVLQQEIRDRLEAWLRAIRAQVPIATEAILDTLPRSFAANDEAQMSSILSAFHEAVERSLAPVTNEFKAELCSMLGRRQALVVDSFAKILHIVHELGLVLPEGMRPSTPSTSEVAVASQHEFLAWLLELVSLEPSTLSREVRQVVRQRVEPGSVYEASHSFASLQSTPTVESIRGHVQGVGHAKLGAGMTLELRCHVGVEHVGHSFVLALEHLASDAGPRSRAPVTVRVNGHVIREQYCPREMHERDGNKLGMWYFASDRWLVDGSFVHAGTNTVSITYGHHGVSLYWLQSLGLHCTLPSTSTDALYTRDIKAILDASLLGRLQLRDDHRQLVDRVLHDTSPIRALGETCNEYMSGLSRLAASHDGRRGDLQRSIDAYRAAAAQIDSVEKLQEHEGEGSAVSSLRYQEMPAGARVQEHRDHPVTSTAAVEDNSSATAAILIGAGAVLGGVFAIAGIVRKLLRDD